MPDRTGAGSCIQLCDAVATGCHCRDEGGRKRDAMVETSERFTGAAEASHKKRLRMTQSEEVATQEEQTASWLMQLRMKAVDEAEHRRITGLRTMAWLREQPTEDELALVDYWHSILRELYGAWMSENGNKDVDDMDIDETLHSGVDADLNIGPQNRHWLRLCLEALKELGTMYMPLKLMAQSDVLKTVLKLGKHPNRSIARYSSFVAKQWQNSMVHHVRVLLDPDIMRDPIGELEEKVERGEITQPMLQQQNRVLRHHNSREPARNHNAFERSNTQPANHSDTGDRAAEEGASLKAEEQQLEGPLERIVKGETVVPKEPSGFGLQASESHGTAVKIDDHDDIDSEKDCATDGEDSLDVPAFYQNVVAGRQRDENLKRGSNKKSLRIHKRATATVDGIVHMKPEKSGHPPGSTLAETRLSEEQESSKEDGPTINEDYQDADMVVNIQQEAKGKDLEQDKYEQPRKPEEDKDEEKDTPFHDHEVLGRQASKVLPGILIDCKASKELPGAHGAVLQSINGADATDSEFDRILLADLPDVCFPEENCDGLAAEDMDDI